MDVVASGGETTLKSNGGILTTGGRGAAGFWEGMAPPDRPWSMALDPLGNYVQVQGTSFSSPNVAGVLALMQGVFVQSRADTTFVASVVGIPDCTAQESTKEAIANATRSPSQQMRSSGDSTRTNCARPLISDCRFEAMRSF